MRHPTFQSACIRNLVLPMKQDSGIWMPNCIQALPPNCLFSLRRTACNTSAATPNSEASRLCIDQIQLGFNLASTWLQAPDLVQIELHSTTSKHCSNLPWITCARRLLSPCRPDVWLSGFPSWLDSLTLHQVYALLYIFRHQLSIWVSGSLHGKRLCLLHECTASPVGSIPRLCRDVSERSLHRLSLFTISHLDAKGV